MSEEESALTPLTLFRRLKELMDEGFTGSVTINYYRGTIAKKIGVKQTEKIGES